MAESRGQKPGSTEADSLIGKAWELHYRGQNEGAIQSFRDLVARYPEHIDANYGLALSLKAAGQKGEAAQFFQKARALVEAANVNKEEDNPRMQMLTRMIDQHLASL